MTLFTVVGLTAALLAGCGSSDSGKTTTKSVGEGATQAEAGGLTTEDITLPTVNVDSIKERILGACQTALTKEGTLYGYPVSAETYTLFQ